MPNLGMGELLIILVVVLLLFGAKRLPEVAKGIGRSLKAFKEGVNEATDDESIGSDNEKKSEHGNQAGEIKPGKK